MPVHTDTRPRRAKAAPRSPFQRNLDRRLAKLETAMEKHSEKLERVRVLLTTTYDQLLVHAKLEQERPHHAKLREILDQCPTVGADSGPCRACRAALAAFEASFRPTAENGS